MTTKLSRRGVLIAACSSAAFASCSILPSTPVPQIYRLSPEVEDPPHQRIRRARLVIDIPAASESLDTDRIAITRGRTRFDYYANSLWTDRVPVLVQTLLIEAFETDGRFAEVGRDAETVTPDYLLKTEVRSFEAQYSGAGDQPPNAVVTMQLVLVKMPDHRIVGNSLVTASTAATDNSVDSAVEAFDAAVGKALTQCIAWTDARVGHAK